MSFTSQCFQAIFRSSLRDRLLSDSVLPILEIVANALSGEISFLDHVASTGRPDSYLMPIVASDNSLIKSQVDRLIVVISAIFHLIVPRPFLDQLSK